MSFFIKELVKNKLKSLSSDELLHYSTQYGFVLSEKQASEITTYLRNHSPDPFDPRKRKEMLEELALITDRETAIKTEKLFEQMIHSYGLKDLFE